MPEPTYFQMGISVPIKNPHFRYGREFYTTLAAAYAAGATTIQINTTTPTTSFPYLNYLVNAGDKLILGPSADLDNENAREEVTIKTIADKDGSDRHEVVLEDGLTFDYSSGDKVTGISQYIPEGWVIQPELYTGVWALENMLISKKLYSFPEDNFGGSSKTLDRGVVGDECVKPEIWAKITGSGYWTYGIWHNIDENDILENTYYRMGCFARLIWSGVFPTGNTTFFMSAMDVDTNYAFTKSAVNLRFDNLAYQSAGEVLNWTEYKGTAFQITALTNPYCRISMGMALPTSPGGSYSVLRSHIQLPFLEHAKGTSADTSVLPSGQTSRAVYTFTELPVQGSEDFSSRDFETDIELSDGSIKTINSSGRKAKSWEYVCNFENVDISFLNDLDILMSHQAAGRRLIFHTNESIGSDPSRNPPLMIGKMFIDRIRRNIWDQNKVSFAFRFKETL